MSMSTNAKHPPECVQNYRMHIPMPEDGTFSSLGRKLVAYDPDDFWSEQTLTHEYSDRSIPYLGDTLLLFYATPDETIITTPEEPNWRDEQGNLLTFLDLAVLLHTSERVRLVTARHDDK